MISKAHLWEGMKWSKESDCPVSQREQPGSPRCSGSGPLSSARASQGLVYPREQTAMANKDKDVSKDVAPALLDQYM